MVNAIKRKKGKGAGVDRLMSLGVALALLGLAQAAATKGLISEYILPPPTAVFSALADGVQRGTYWPHLESTALASMAGFGVAALLGVIVAGILVSIPRLESILYPFIIAFQTVPKIAIAPLIVLGLGFGTTSKVTTVVIVSFFPVLVNAMQGLRIREQERYDLLRSLGATRFQLLRYLRLPSALPYIFAGLHISIIFALTGSVVAEFVGSQSGLGLMIIQEQANFNVPGVYAVLTILMLLGLIFHLAMVALERKLAFWADDLTLETL